MTLCRVVCVCASDLMFLVEMPSEGLPLMVTSGLGIGVFAGVVSGICYVFLQGFRNNSRNRKYGVITSTQCCVCGAHFTTNSSSPKSVSARSVSPRWSSVKETRRVTCSECHGVCCRGGKCSLYLREETVWICTQCRKPTGWLSGVLAGFTRDGFTVRMSKEINPNSLEHKNESNAPGEEKEVVRDFIERLVGAMLEANLDDTSVSRLYRDPEYDAMFGRYHSDISAALTELGSALHISIANLPISGQTPCSAHATLKAIIRRILRDASNLPVLKDPAVQDELPPETANQTYEDLLATAILNKVIDNYQHDHVRRSSTSSSGGQSKKSEKHKKKSKSSVNKEQEAPTWRPQDIDSTSVSSVEDWCRSESSYGSKHVDPISLTIQHSIEEISNTSSSDDLPQHFLHSNSLSRNSFRDEVDSVGGEREDWQDNWLFSRKGKGSPKPVPVPMLVPSPNTELRAMIGDRDAEDTTDLSETGSDIDDAETVSSIKNILVDSRTIIGGKNLLENINPELLEPRSITNDEFERSDDFGENNETPIVEVHVDTEVILNGHYSDDERDYDEQEESDEVKGEQVKEDILPKEELIVKNIQEEILEPGIATILKTKVSVLQPKARSDSGEEVYDLTEAKNNAVIAETPYEESDSISSNTEKDAEYTEKYASFPRPIKKKSPVPSPRTSHINGEDLKDILDQNTDITTLQINDESVEHVEDLDEIPPVSIKGSYSEREKEKWKNPIAMAHNPYSKENLDRRLQNRSSPDSHTFGRDYYVRHAKRAAGGKDKEVVEPEDAMDDLPRPKSLPLKSNGYGEEYTVNPDVFTAVPALIDDEETKPNDESLGSEGKLRPHSLALSTDSDDVDVKRVYNVETGEMKKLKSPDMTKEIRESSRTPIGIKQFIVDEMLTPSENKTFDIPEKFDENHNNSYENENISEPVMKIASLKDLQHVGVINIPAYEERSCTIELSDEFSLSSKENDSAESNTNIEVPEEVLETPEVPAIQEVSAIPEEVAEIPVMREVSKKYLNSLVKSPNKPYSLGTPSISLVENEQNSVEKRDLHPTKSVKSPINWIEKQDYTPTVLLSPVNGVEKEDFTPRTPFPSPVIMAPTKSVLPENGTDIKETANNSISLIDSFDETDYCPTKVQPPVRSFEPPKMVKCSFDYTEQRPESPLEIEQINGHSNDQHDSPMNLETSSRQSPISKSCADIPREEENTFLTQEYPTLKEKKIVSHFIEDITKSVPNLQDIGKGKEKKRPKSFIELEPDLATAPSVKDLRKLFDKDKPKWSEPKRTKTSHLGTQKMQNTKQVHSLTARSIPTQVRRELSKPEEEETPNVNGLTQKEFLNEENELKQLPACQSKIAFYERLKNNK